MDPRLHGTSNSSSEFQLDKQSMDEFSSWDLENGQGSVITYADEQFEDGNSFQERSIGGEHVLRNQIFPNGAIHSTSFVDINDDDHSDRDLSDGMLRYIDKILMEEDMEENTQMLQESLDFQAKERSFYEVLGQKYPPSPQQESTLNGQYGDQRPDNNYGNHHNSEYLINVVDQSWHHTRTDYDAYRTDYIISNSTNISSSSNLNNVMDRFSDSPMRLHQIGDKYSGSEVVRFFLKGVDDGRKFLPSGSKMLGMNQHPEENDCEIDRSNKLPAVDTESNVPVEEFNDVWIYTVDERVKNFSLAAYMAELKITGSEVRVKGSSKARGRCVEKQNRLVDLTSLLINCAESIAAGDLHTASEFLKQIRQHSSPFGNAHQRLAHYFADGLEARLAGTDSELYVALVHERKPVPDYLKAHCLSLFTSSLRKILNFASNKMIMIKSEKATIVHIIDFGISYGFHWPVFIQRVAKREGGPPTLRITGIDLPQPGSRPAERIKDTGRRLAHYAKMFNVPFEYNSIAQNWDSIKVDDLKIEKGEFVAVTCSFRAKNLAESSKTTFLDLIRKINPDIFIHAIDNGAYSGPFFVTRFREALFHFSSLFDMLDTILPGDKPERMVIERDIFRKEVLNVIACEGQERVERPETYKQWQVRFLEAGFTQVPFERELMDTVMYNVRNSYHRHLIIVEDKPWLLMSWKGRIFYAISGWQPVREI